MVTVFILKRKKMDDAKCPMCGMEGKEGDTCPNCDTACELKCPNCREVKSKCECVSEV